MTMRPRRARDLGLALLLVPALAVAQASDLVTLAASGKAEEIRQALANGAKANAQDTEGRTALTIAVARQTSPLLLHDREQVLVPDHAQELSVLVHDGKRAKAVLGELRRAIRQGIAGGQGHHLLRHDVV